MREPYDLETVEPCNREGTLKGVGDFHGESSDTVPTNLKALQWAHNIPRIRRIHCPVVGSVDPLAKTRQAQSRAAIVMVSRCNAAV